MIFDGIEFDSQFVDLGANFSILRLELLRSIAQGLTLKSRGKALLTNLLLSLICLG